MSTSITIRTCRLCLDSNCTSSVSMDEENGWLKLLEFCVGLVLTGQDEPRVLCEQCADQIENYVKFKKQCQKSDLFWKSQIKSDVQKSYENYVFVKNEDEEYLASDLDLDAENNHEIETYFEVKNNIVDQKIHYDQDLNDNNDTKFHKLNENETKEEKHFSPCDENSSDAKKIKQEDIKVFELINVENLESNESVGNNSSHICSKCTKSYASKKWLNRHITTCNGKLREYKKKEPIEEFLCGICDFTDLNIDGINQHLNIVHFSNNELNCKLCDFRGYDLASMETHRFSHQDNVSKSFITCHKCSKRFGSPLSLEFHYRSVHLGQPGGICIVCNDKGFNNFKSWKIHVRSHQLSRYICDHCGKKYLYRYSIEAHLRDHSDVKNYVCDECGKRFKRMYGLKLHVSTVHVKTEPLKCTHCNKIFKSPQSLEKHMKYVSAEKIFQCQMCSKCFGSQKILNNHIFWHSEERPHCCDICGSSYKAKSQLKLHMRKHTGEKPYHCLQCYKKFHTPGLLKRHGSVHTGVRPFKCLHCEKTFYSNSARQVHCAKRHKDR